MDLSVLYHDISINLLYIYAIYAHSIHSDHPSKKEKNLNQKKIRRISPSSVKHRQTS